MSVESMLLCKGCGDDVGQCGGKCGCNECQEIAFKHLR